MESTKVAIGTAHAVTTSLPIPQDSACVLRKPHSRGWPPASDPVRLPGAQSLSHESSVPTRSSDETLRLGSGFTGDTTRRGGFYTAVARRCRGLAGARSDRWLSVPGSVFVTSFRLRLRHLGLAQLFVVNRADSAHESDSAAHRPRPTTSGSSRTGKRTESDSLRLDLSLRSPSRVLS